MERTVCCMLRAHGGAGYHVRYPPLPRAPVIAWDDSNGGYAPDPAAPEALEWTVRSCQQ